MLRKIVGAVSIYLGLPKDIYFIAFARFLLGLGNFIIPFLVLLLTQKLGYSTTVAGGLAMGGLRGAISIRNPYRRKTCRQLRP